MFVRFPLLPYLTQGGIVDLAIEENTLKTYSIRHPHARQKATALATLRSVIDNLGLGLTIPDEGSPIEQVKAPGRWEAQLGHSKTYITATINVHKGLQPDLEMAFLDVTDHPDRWN